MAELHKPDEDALEMEENLNRHRFGVAGIKRNPEKAALEMECLVEVAKERDRLRSENARLKAENKDLKARPADQPADNHIVMPGDTSSLSIEAAIADRQQRNAKPADAGDEETVDQALGQRCVNECTSPPSSPPQGDASRRVGELTGKIPRWEEYQGEKTALPPCPKCSARNSVVIGQGQDCQELYCNSCDHTWNDVFKQSASSVAGKDTPLPPCLCCGSKTIGIDSGFNSFPGFFHQKALYWTVCRSCGVRGPEKDSKAQAVAAWRELCDLVKAGKMAVHLRESLEADHALAERVRALIEEKALFVDVNLAHLYESNDGNAIIRLGRTDDLFHGVPASESDLLDKEVDDAKV